MKRIGIIGSGLGGLLCGYLLSKEGFDVTVLEKHHKPGGCLQTFQRGEFTFDTGMHYIGSMAPGQTLYNYWQYFGLNDHLNLLKMDENGFDRISFDPPNTSAAVMEFPLAQGFTNFRHQLLSYFPGSEKALKHYTNTLQKVACAHPLYNMEMPSKGNNDLFRSIRVRDFLQRLPLPHPLSKRGDESSLASWIPLANVLSGNDFLYAGNPITTPLSLFGLINHSFIASAWRIPGGSQQIANLLVDGIRGHGGKVLLKKQVVAICMKGDTFQLSTIDGETVDANRVIADIHPAKTLQLLEGIPISKAYGQRLLNMKNTTSVFSVYLGFKPRGFPFLNYNGYHHVSAHNRATTVNPTPGIDVQHWPSRYLFMTPPEKNQGSFARTAIIMAPMRFDEVRSWEENPLDMRDQSYLLFKEERANQLLELVGQKYPGIKEAIATIDTSTPLTWQDYTGTPEGAMYGIVRDADHPEITTLFPKTKIPGLFFTGQNINLHGSLGVTIGAVMTCAEILGLPYVLKTIKQ